MTTVRGDALPMLQTLPVDAVQDLPAATITYDGLIKGAATHRRPLVLSTGMSESP